MVLSLLLFIDFARDGGGDTPGLDKHHSAAWSASPENDDRALRTSGKV